MSLLYNFLSDHADKIPFAVAAAGNHQPKMSGVRVLEAVIIALGSGAILSIAGYFFMVPKVIEGVAVRIEYVERQVLKNQTRNEVQDDRINSLQRQIDRGHPDRATRATPGP